VFDQEDYCNRPRSSEECEGRFLDAKDISLRESRKFLGLRFLTVKTTIIKRAIIPTDILGNYKLLKKFEQFVYFDAGVS
jgi:hypothetical protein